jgi:hypothetical protein
MEECGVDTLPQLAGSLLIIPQKIDAIDDADDG